MARQRAVRAGYRWQPAAIGRRAAGRRSWRLPRVVTPRWTASWRRALLLTVVAALLASGGWWLYHSPLLSVRDVHVRGNAVLPTDVVRDIAGLDGESIVRPDLGAARDRVLAHPLVKDAQLSRDWPNGVTVTIVERAPWGYWQQGDRRYAIDGEGVVLDLPAPESAPVVVQTDGSLPAPLVGDRVDIGAVRVAGRLVATAEQTVGRPVERLEFSRASGLTAVLAGDLRVTFGDAQGYEFKVAALFAILQRAQAEGRTLTKVDLRFGDRVAVQ